MKWFLDQDSSCHWYLVPAEKRAEWDVWTNLDEDDEAAWESPAWAERINGHPNQIEFTYEATECTADTVEATSTK